MTRAKLEITYAFIAAIIFAFLWAPLNSLGTRALNWVSPVVGPFYATDWQQDGDGYWSASVIGTKYVDACRYVPGQIVTGAAFYPDDGITRELFITYIDDETPDSTRPAGTQYFGRWQTSIPHLPVGTTIAVSVQHICPDRTSPVVSPIRPMFIVGVDTVPD